ncbi:class I SAM-dependent methyltransferase [Archangium lipolyticum]|uniref:class I SAM-dependent methyltransferase n=1 Tax=Archangium lipolyticum TaxID=2970465 RepID=UPI002149FE1F|nr:class I SAM-dependent methyltransferase [Archangium lipolyticum]
MQALVREEGVEWGTQEVGSGLDQACDALAGGETRKGMQLLFSTLGHARSVLDGEDWKQFCRDCLTHPLRELVHQDPIARRSFARPRGYAGDAVLLDLMYQTEMPERARASKLGQELCQFMYEQPSAVSLRGRRDLLARRINDLAEEVPDARVLSLACGHLREAHLSQAVRERRLGRFLAVDQDPKSLAVVQRELVPLGIEAVPGSVKAVLRGQLAFSDLDFIYAAGLYDYLPQPIAIRLTRTLFSMLRPGGKLLLANYIDATFDSGCKAYMEAFMDWWLIYREEHEVREWLQDIPRSELATHRLFRDDVGNLIYLEAVRR